MNVKSINYVLLEKAVQDLRTSKRNHGPNASIWDLSMHWTEKKQEILHQLHLGQYRFSLCYSYFKDGILRTYWQAADAVVLKAISYLLKKTKDNQDCHHLKGHGGIHESLKALSKAKPNYQKVFKSDMDSYYASINHNILLHQLKNFIDCTVLHDLFKQYLKRVEIKNDGLHTFKIAIPMGCSLAILDEQLKRFGFYRRYMDDWVVLVNTRAQLRKVIKITHQVLKTLTLSMHPKKTFIGCIEKGFAFLGIQWKRKPEIAINNTKNHQIKLALRYA